MTQITREETKRIKNLCLNLIETLDLTLRSVADYSMKHNIPLPRDISPLLDEASSLMRELGESRQPICNGEKSRTPSTEDAPEPLFVNFIC